MSADRIEPIEHRAMELGAHGLADLLHHVADWAQDHIEGVLGAHMIAFGSGPIVGEHASNDVMVEIVERIKVSPVWEELLRSGGPVDVGHEDLPALDTRVAAVRSIPFAGGADPGHPLGILLLAQETAGPSAADIAVALAAIAPTVHLLARHALDEHRRDELAVHLDDPVATAVGVLMARADCDSGEARRLLRDRADAEACALAEVAARTVALVAG